MSYEEAFLRWLMSSYSKFREMSLNKGYHGYYHGYTRGYDAAIHYVDEFGNPRYRFISPYAVPTDQDATQRWKMDFLLSQVLEKHGDEPRSLGVLKEVAESSSEAVLDCSEVSNGLIGPKKIKLAGHIWIEGYKFRVSDLIHEPLNSSAVRVIDSQRQSQNIKRRISHGTRGN